MSLRLKLSILFCGGMLSTVLFTALVLSRSFASDQEAYRNELHNTQVLGIQRALGDRLELLYSQVATLTASADRFETASRALPGIAAARLWRNGRLVVGSPLAAPLPSSGTSRWTLLPIDGAHPGAGVRWLARFGVDQVALDLTHDWLSDTLVDGQGSRSELVAGDGTVLLRSGRGSAIRGREAFEQPELLAKMLSDSPGVARTLRYRALDGSDVLGAFLVLDADPPVLAVVKASGDVVDAVLRRTYARSAWLALAALVLAATIGIAFGGTLVSPLRQLTLRIRDVAQGRLDAKVTDLDGRGDEVGDLARSFNRMIDELGVVRAELRRSERLAALGKFGASIAHEIKNPLAGILGNVQLARRAALPLDVDQALSFAELETKRANRTLIQLLKFARNDREPTTTIDLSERLRTSMEVLAAGADRAGVTLVRELASEPLPCRANGDEIHEVLANLVQNALHAVRESATKRVTVRLERDGDWAVLVVEDSGPGIAPEALDRLFEPFFTTKDIGEGTGLGLAVCHGIAQSHRGSLEATNPPGGGARFALRLPLLSETNAKAA